MLYDIAIIGAGWAGLTAAVYARRAGKTVIVIEGESFGGQIASSPLVENYPGIKSITGLELTNGLLQQATDLGAKIEIDRVKEVQNFPDKKILLTEFGQYEAKTLIIATGVTRRKLGLPREAELTGKGVAYCTVCDGAFFKNKVTAIAGGGNAAVRGAMYLSEYCEKVYLIHRRDQFRAEQKLVETAKKIKNIEFILNSKVITLNGEKKLASVTLENNQGEKSELITDGLFVAIGQKPNNAVFANLLKLDEEGFIVAGEDCLTQVEGIFVAGDCRTKQVRQLTTAGADGAIAALTAGEYLDQRK